IGTFGQCRRKVKMASRLTMAHSMQNRMMPRQRKQGVLTWACLLQSCRTEGLRPLLDFRPSAGEPQTLAWPRSAENLQGVHMNKK
ncbi:hypothetical protein AMEX_G16559, partial [Astyanax mexicanus]